MTYALDSNTVSYFLRCEGLVQHNFQREIIEAGNAYAIPWLVVYEIKRWLLDNPTKTEKLYNKNFEALFYAVAVNADMNADVWAKATDIYIELKQTGKLIKDADILIAAYCLVNGYTLVTRNTKDFNRIKGLEFINWHE